ncbi:MAG: ThuA domain-containing protein [bacterium]|nr:ThuA domain-containing protein [bacterium]
MNCFRIAVGCLLALFTVVGNADEKPSAEKSPPLRALLIAGGCCHDYAKQQEIIAKGIMERANVRVDVYWSNDKSTAPVFPLYSAADWANKYDVIIHDECAAAVKDAAIVNRIVQTHQKIPAVHLHCAMHSFRLGNETWFKHLGLQSSGHGPQAPIDIHFSDTDHPITATLKDWTTINEELYNNVKILDAHPIASGKQMVGKGDKKRQAEAVVVWTNEKQGARSFSTTLGHNNATVADDRYLELVTRGLLWSCDKLNDAYLKPYTGENSVKMIDGKKVKAEQPVNVGAKPKNATLTKLAASSTQDGHPTYHSIDGNRSTRWCANGGAYPQSLTLEYEKPSKLSEIDIAFEFSDKWYQFKVEGSVDGKKWVMLLDQSENQKVTPAKAILKDAPAVRFVRITGLKSQYGWFSIREINLKGEGLAKLWPADAKSKPGDFSPVRADPYTKQGNVPPRIERLTAEAEANILKGVKVADGFEATVFAAPPAVNYPVFVAASPDGTLYVSSDGNGSLGRDPKRGRVIRLRDLDGDGRADETKVFCEIDAPRGLVWDHDRLYLMHPPHLSEFIDTNGDGVADKQNILVKNLAFGYDKRPADHTTNGLSMGPDGWLYVAGGDFGFIDAEGTDGRKLTHRGGGVIRVRPDGTGLEIYSTGTRNILEVAISPRLDIFARDNTNDGGGWDVRFHHFTGMDNHGYPRLYKNFNDECVQPLADYGGGSGCGAVYIDEPGFGDWNDAPFTADWGTGAIYRHAVEPAGATFRETKKPEPLIRMTRPTDADVDGNSNVYCASWKGATFKWAGPDVGFIICVKPKDFKPTPLPDFEKASDEELVKLLGSPSYRRRVAAQRTLLRRGHSSAEQMMASAVKQRNSQRNLVADLQTTGDVDTIIKSLSSDDPVIVHVAINRLAHDKAYQACFAAFDSQQAPAKPLLRSLAMMHEPAVVAELIARLDAAKDSANRHLLWNALARLHFLDGEWKGDSWGTRPDTRGPYYQPEAWSETPKIAAVLKSAYNDANSEDAAFLLETMNKNRIPLGATLDDLIRRAANNKKLRTLAINRIAASKEIPSSALPLIMAAISDESTGAVTLADAVQALAKLPAKDVADPLLTAMTRLQSAKASSADSKRAEKSFANAANLHVGAETFAKAASEVSPRGNWARTAILAIAEPSSGSPESQALAAAAIESAWKSPALRIAYMQTAEKTKSSVLNDRILAARQDSDANVAKVAAAVATKLKLKDRPVDNSPKIGSIDYAVALKAAITTKGDVGLGEQLFKKATCTACHTTELSQTQKGPFLGTIAKTYKRPDLAAAILNPDKTIAQGFATNIILTEDGVLKTGYVTAELADRVVMRDQKGKEFTIMKDVIEERKTSPKSVMPAGLMNVYTTHEFASLLDYLQSLSKK